jgi:hypothetical protein
VHLDERPRGCGFGGDERGRDTETGVGGGKQSGGFELGVGNAVRVVDVEAVRQRGEYAADAVAGLGDGEPGVRLVQVRKCEPGGATSMTAPVRS